MNAKTVSSLRHAAVPALGSVAACATSSLDRIFALATVP